MATIKFHKVLVLPGTLEADSLYFVQNASYTETYLTDTAGVANRMQARSKYGAKRPKKK